MVHYHNERYPSVLWPCHKYIWRHVQVIPGDWALTIPEGCPILQTINVAGIQETMDSKLEIAVKSVYLSWNVMFYDSFSSVCLHLNSPKSRSKLIIHYPRTYTNMYALANMRRYTRVMAMLRWISKCFRRLHVSIQLPTEIILSCPSHYADWYCFSTPPPLRTKIHPSFNKYVTKFTWSNKSIPVLLLKEYWLRRHLTKEPISYAGDWNLRWCSMCSFQGQQLVSSK